MSETDYVITKDVFFASGCQFDIDIAEVEKFVCSAVKKSLDDF